MLLKHTLLHTENTGVNKIHPVEKASVCNCSKGFTCKQMGPDNEQGEFFFFLPVVEMIAPLKKKKKKIYNRSSKQQLSAFSVVKQCHLISTN